VILTAFEHRRGLHCGTTAMTDVLRFYGCDLTEPLAFGLGAGCSFTLHDGSLRVQPPQPRRLFAGRSPTFEADLCAALGAKLTRLNRWSDAQLKLTRAHPALAWTDLFELKYLGAHGHWGGHLVVIAGLKDQSVVLADNERDELQTVSLEQLLAAARPGVEPDPGAPYFACVEGARPADKGQLAQAAVDAIAKQARDMLGGERTGMVALEAFARELPAWGSLPDWQRCVRMAAQVIEVRGSGGGLFRRLYARFLAEAVELGASYAAELLPPAEDAANAWTSLAVALDTAGKEPKADLRVAGFRAQEAAKREKALWSKAEELFGGAAGW
jgi:hypothetical protein